MQLNDVQILLIVNFLQSTCIGLIAPFVSPHTIAIGGNHIVVGLITTGYTTCTMLSKDFVALFKYGLKFMLMFCMFFAFVGNLLPAISASCWLLGMGRYICALTNQIDILSKEFVSEIEPKDTHVKIFQQIDILRTVGLIIGAISGSYIFDQNSDFESNAIIAANLCLVGVLLAQYLSQDPEREKIGSSIPTLPQECYNQLSKLTQVDYKQNWDAFILEIAYVSSFTIYFSKFPSLIKYNYEVGIIILGYTVAYQSMLIFASNYVVPVLKDWLKRFPEKQVFHYSLLFCATTLMGLYFAPTYECYLIVFVPTVVSYTLVNCLIEEGALNLEKEQEVNNAIDTLRKMINIFGPFVFGIIYHLFGGKAFKLMAILPPAVCAYIINQRVIVIREEYEEHLHTD